MEVKCNSEIISKLDLDEQFIYFSYNKYRGIKELSNGNFILLFENIFYYINSKTFRVLNIGESLKKYFCENTSFSYIEEINEQLVGIISNNYVLIVQINNKEAKLFQEITIKANILKSFKSENLIIINEYIEEKEKNLNILHYYTYDKNLKYQLKAKEEINFKKFANTEIAYYNLFNYITNIKKFKNGKIYLFTLSSIPFEENQNFDSLYRSFYERDCILFLNIYLYENKELTEIYNRKYKKHFIYSNNFYESNFNDFLKIWYDENLLIDEKSNKIAFISVHLSRLIIVDIQEKKAKRIKIDIEDFKSSFYDKKSNLWYFVQANEDFQIQRIILYKLSEESLYLIKIIHLPYYFNDICITKKGYLLGVAKNTLTIYSFYQHLERYAPTRIIQTSLCLLNISI